MTWQLVSQSFRILRDDLELIVFPILSAIGALALSLPFVLAFFAGGEMHWGPNSWLYVFLWYAGASFVMIFFNCALAACVQMRLAGQEGGIADGLRRAAARTPDILIWALITSTVGRLLQAVEQRWGWTGRIAGSLLGVSWNLATFLIVPVLVMEDGGVTESLRRSASLLRETWGEQIVSGIAFGWIGLLVAVPGIVLGVLGANGHPVFIVPTVLWFAAMLAAFSAAREIFTVVLYRYAVTGQSPAGCDLSILNPGPRPIE
jgi:hypothetical protein